MPDDNKPAGGASAPPPAKERSEKPGMERVSENYFKQVNAEFEKIVKEKPQEMMNEKLIDEISKRNEKSFEHKVVDALKSPGEALKWGGNMLKTYAAAWLAEMFDLKKHFFGLKDKVKGWVDEKTKGFKKKLEGLREWIGKGKGPSKDEESAKEEKSTEETDENEIQVDELEKVGPQYYCDLLPYLLEGKDFVVNNEELVAAFALLNAGRIKAAAGGSKDVLVALFKMPWPKKLLMMGSFFGALAMLMHIYKVNELGKIKVPKDSKNFKKWILHKLEAEKEKIGEFLSSEGVSTPEFFSNLHLHLDIMDDLAQGKKKMKDFIAHPEDMAKHLTEGAFEFFRSNPEKYVRQQNQKGLKSFSIDLEKWAIAPDVSADSAKKCGELRTKVGEILSELQQGKPLTQKHIEILQKGVESLGLDLEVMVDDGYLLWRGLNERRIITKGPKYIGIDPSLPMDQQFDKAWMFSTVPDLMKAPGKGLEIMKYQVQHVVDIVKKSIDGGGILYLLGEGLEAVLYAYGKKYILGPWELLKDVKHQIVNYYEGKEVSGYEMLVHLQDGLLPVFCVGLTKTMAIHLAKGKLGEVLNVKSIAKGIVLESALYQVTGGFRTLRAAWRGAKVMFRGEIGELLANPLYRATDSFFELNHRWGGFFRRKISFQGSVREAIGQKQYILEELYSALGWLQGATSPKYREPPAESLKKARDALERAGMKSRVEFPDKNMPAAKDAVKKIFDEVNKLENEIMGMERTGKIEPLASEAAKAGEAERLKKLELDAKELEAAWKNLQRELEQRRKYIVDTATAQRKSVTDPEIAEQLRALEQSLGPKISAAEESFMRFFHGHPELGREPLPKTPRTGVPEVPTKIPHGPELKPRIPSKVKRIGLHFLGLGAGIGLSAALGVGLGKGLEAFAEKEDEFSIEPVSARKKSGEDAQAGGMRFLDDYAKSFNSEYSVLYDRLSYDKLQQYDKEDSLPLVVQNMASEHLKIVEKMKAFLAIPGNQQLLFRFFEQLAGTSFADLKKPKKITEYFALSYDASNKELLFHYASEDDFKAQMYDFADFVMRHDGRTEAKQSDLAKDAVKYATPGLGIYMDARDTRNAVRRGQVGRALKSGLWTGVGAFADAAALTGFGALLTGAVRGTVLATKSARAAKIAMLAGLGGGALDVAYQLFTPKHSEVMKIARPDRTFVSEDLKPQALPGDIAGTRN